MPLIKTPIDVDVYLLNLKVTILEARDRIGGRIHDDFFGDVCVGKGAQIVVGSVNNPLMVMAHQVSKYIGNKLFAQEG